jgi:hypothetical protein
MAPLNRIAPVTKNDRDGICRSFRCLGGAWTGDCDDHTHLTVHQISGQADVRYSVAIGGRATWRTLCWTNVCDPKRVGDRLATALT